MKKILTLCVILFLLIGCGQPAEPEPIPTEVPTETAVITPIEPTQLPEPTEAPSVATVIQAWGEAINAGDVDLALSFLADEASIQLIPPPLPDHDGVFAGKAAIRGWYEIIIAAHAQSTIHDVQVEGERVTAVITYTDDSLKAVGVDVIDNVFEAVVRDGKLQTYTATVTPESLAKFGPPPEAIVTAFTDAVTAGDWDTAVSLFAEGAIVTITPPPSGRASEYKGASRIRRWLDGNAAQNFEVQREIQAIDGKTVTVQAMM